jgi:hypothetical protein
MLNIINAFRPQRIVNIHAIRDTNSAGIFADPRTDHNGIALGYETDSSLAIDMAKFINSKGGLVRGNKLDDIATTRYHRDPPAAAKGKPQERTLEGSVLPGKRGSGISLGSWASTAVYDTVERMNNRPAIRILTMEFPGYKRPFDYTTVKEQDDCKKLIELYAAAITKVFLQDVYIEEDGDYNPFLSAASSIK